MIRLSRGPGTFWDLWCVLWQQLQVFQGGVSHVAGEGGAIILKLIALCVGDAIGPATTQRRAVKPLVVRLEQGEHSVHHPPSCRQLQFLDHSRVPVLGLFVIGVTN
jgi:hypothetical protein